MRTGGVRLFVRGIFFHAPCGLVEKIYMSNHLIEPRTLAVGFVDETGLGQATHASEKGWLRLVCCFGKRRHY